jgi:outer membrane autotransporter protein
MALITPRRHLRLILATSLLTVTGGASFLKAQVVPVGNPTVPPPITIVTVTPGDPGDPGFPPAGEATPAATTVAPTEPKDMKDVKNMKSSVTYNAGCGDYFELFITGSGTYGDMGNSNDPGHYDFDRAQGNLGAEYHFASDWTVGAILSYAHVDSSYGNLNASSTTDSYVPTLFVSYYHQGWWARLSTSDGYDTFTEQRGTPTGQANGAGDGWQYGGKLTGGYLFLHGDWSYGPVIDVHGYQLDASGFNEDGGGINDLHFNHQNSYTLQSQIGGLVRYDTQLCGVKLQPYFSASWQREYGDASQQISGNNITNGASFSGSSVYLDRDAALIDLGVRAKVSSNVDVYLGYEGLVGGNFVTSTAEGGVSVSF